MAIKEGLMYGGVTLLRRRRGKCGHFEVLDGGFQENHVLGSQIGRTQIATETAPDESNLITEDDHARKPLNLPITETREI
jgi:hypothetical protein